MDNIRKKTIVSTLSLFFQSGYSAFLGLIANLVLTILLSPAIFGIYIATLSIISILNYFSDIGLAASLIQKNEITIDDEKTAFTVQQILIISLVVIGYIVSPHIAVFYKLPPDGRYLFLALLFGFFFSSLKTLPSIFLERKIQFQKIVLVQVIENTCFYLIVIILALMKFGLSSFTYAVIVRSIIGVVAIYLISPWKPKIGINKQSFKQLVSFGLPFQASSLLALVKDDLLNLYLGKALGFQALGYIGWAKKWAEAPIRIIMDNLSRILFPVFSRFQQDKEKLRKLIEKTIFYQSSIIIPAIVGAVLLMDKFIHVIPKYSKWETALPLFYLFCLAALFSSFSTPFINLLNGLGKIKISFYFMVGWTLSTWILTPVLTYLLGPVGFPLTLFILSSSFILVIAQTKKIVDFSFIRNVTPFVISSLLMSFLILMIFQIRLPDLSILLISIPGGIISYLIILYYIFKINFISELKFLTKKNE